MWSLPTDLANYSVENILPAYSRKTNLFWLVLKNSSNINFKTQFSAIFFNYVNRELEEGITVYDENRNELGKSKKAAVEAVSTVIVSRIAMCAPGMG